MTLQNGALAAKLGFFTLWSFAAVSQLRNGGSYATKWHSCAKWWFRSSKVISQLILQLISQLRNECMGLPNGTRVPKSGFAVAKLPAEWGFGCENWEFLRFGIS